MYNSYTDEPKTTNSTEIIFVDEGFYSVSLGDTSVDKIQINLEKVKISSKSETK